MYRPFVVVRTFQKKNLVLSLNCKQPENVIILLLRVFSPQQNISQGRGVVVFKATTDVTRRNCLDTIYETIIAHMPLVRAEQQRFTSTAAAEARYCRMKLRDKSYMYFETLRFSRHRIATFISVKYT